jgi:hypothetical protein
VLNDDKKSDHTTGTESQPDSNTQVSDKDFILDYLGTAKNFDAERDQFASGNPKIFPSKSTLGMAKCFLNAKSENLLDDKKISFCRVITDLSRADPKKSLKSEFEQCLRSILGIELETLEDFFEVDLEFKSVLADFESSGDLKNFLFKLKLCLGRGSLKLFIETKRRATHTSHNM